MAVQQFLPEVLWLTVMFLAPHSKVIYLGDSYGEEVIQVPVKGLRGRLMLTR